MNQTSFCWSSLLDVAVGPVVDEPGEEAPVDLGGDPLACVLGRLEERDRAGAVARGACTGGELEGLDRLAEDRLSDRLLLDQLGVARREVVVPLLERDVRRRAGAGAGSRLQAPRPEDVVAVHGVGERVGRRGRRAGVRERHDGRALVAQRLGLGRRRHDAELSGLADGLDLVEVIAGAGEQVGRDPAADRVLVERLDGPVAGRLRGADCKERERRDAREPAAGLGPDMHGASLGPIPAQPHSHAARAHRHMRPRGNCHADSMRSMRSPNRARSREPVESCRNVPAGSREISLAQVCRLTAYAVRRAAERQRRLGRAPRTAARTVRTNGRTRRELIHLTRTICPRVCSET